MSSVENVTLEGGIGSPVSSKSGGDGNGAVVKHPSSVLMMLLNVPMVEETVVRRVQSGFGDEFKVLKSENVRILTLELDFLTGDGAIDMAKIIAEEIDFSRKSAEEENKQKCVASYEIVPGEGGRLRNIRINVSTKTPLGRKVLRLELAEFVLRCFRRNSTCAYFIKQLELRP